MNRFVTVSVVGLLYLSFFQTATAKLTWKTCGEGAFAVVNVTISPYPILRKNDMHVTVEVNSSTHYDTAKHPSTTRVKLFYEGWLEVYNHDFNLCDLCPCPITEGHLDLSYTKLIPSYALSGTYKITLEGYEGPTVLFCVYGDVQVTSPKSNDDDYEHLTFRHLENIDWDYDSNIPRLNLADCREEKNFEM